jgi:hypothetical protein
MAGKDTITTPPIRYRVLRNSKFPPGGKFYDATTIEAEGLCWDDAKAMSERLQQEEAASKPLQTSWTYDIFFCEREDVVKSQVGLSPRVCRSKRRKAVSAPARSPERAVQLAIQW